MSDRKSKPFVQGDDDRVKRQLDELQKAQLEVVQHELSELESMTPPPYALPDEIREHWKNQNDRILRIHQDQINSTSAALLREIQSLREEQKHTAWLMGIMWKIMIFLGVTAVGGLGASYSAVKNSGEIEGDIKAQILGSRRDLDRHEQILQYLTTHPIEQK